MNERRSINKEDKERLRGVSKKIKKCIRDQKNQEGNKKSCKKNREHQICKGKKLHSEEKNTKDEVITSRRGISNVFRELSKKVYDDEIEDKTMRGESDSEAKHNEEAQNMRSRSSQKKRYRQPSIDSNVESAVTATESELRTSKDATMRQRNDETDLQWSIEQRQPHSRDVSKNTNQSDSQKKETCRMLLMSAQIVLCLPCTNCCSPHYCASGFTDLCQPADQGGFKRSHQTVDHLMVNRMLEQRCREWSIPMFISTIDFTKAFDRVKHQSLWNALKHFEIEPEVHWSLEKIVHIDQKATVLTDSVTFETKRGTKTEQAFFSISCYSTRWKMTWRNGSEPNRGFGDDVFFFSTSLSKLKDKLSDLQRKYTASVGVEIQSKQNEKSQ